MKENVYLINAKDNEDDAILCAKLKELISSQNLLDFIKDRDATAIKTHFGEVSELGYARPLYFKMLGDIIKSKGGLPFLTETSTLYKGNRNNAIKHISHANNQGFDFASTGLPIIMADGLFGDDEHEVPINGKIYKSVKIAALFAKCNCVNCCVAFYRASWNRLRRCVKKYGHGLFKPQGENGTAFNS